MDDERLKNPNHVFGRDYFEEQLARVRDIRSSERRFYQKITDIYAQCIDQVMANQLDLVNIEYTLKQLICIKG